jgi:hypothetical protein
VSNKTISIPCTKEPPLNKDKCEKNSGDGKGLKISDIP